MKTDLNDRELFYDGTSRVKPDLVPELFLHGATPDKLRVLYLNEDVELFNQLSDETISTDADVGFEPNLTWQLPESIEVLDLPRFFAHALRQRGLEKAPEYVRRVELELAEVERRGLQQLIKALIFVVSTFVTHKQVWGVGRGSSCASLLLFLIGLHKVDPVKYGIPLEEFFHD